MDQQSETRPARGGAAGAAFGVAMIVIGGLWLAGRTLDVDVWDYGWPLFIILPGAVLLIVGLAARGAAATAAMVPGAIITMVGLVLLYQDANDHYESWAYAWALISPGAVGAALWLAGVRNDKPGQRRAGLALMRVGLAVFLVGFFILEGLVGISDRDLGVVGDYALPFLLIAAGFYLLLRRR